MPTSYGKSDFLSVGAAAARLGISVDTLRRWADRGQIASTRTPTGYRRFTEAEVERVLAGEQASA